MYGNFTSNFFKLNFTQKIFKYSIDLSPEISDNSYDFLNTLEKKIKNNLNFPCLIKRRTLYSNQMLPPDITTTIESENVKYIVTIIQTSNIFLTDKIEQKEFLKLLFSEYMEDLKYFKFKKAYYNPFEVYDDKSLKIWRWNGFSIHISQFFNEFSLEITPKNLIFQKENCQELLKKIEELQPGIRKSQSNLKSLFRGHAIKAR